DRRAQDQVRSRRADPRARDLPLLLPDSARQPLRRARVLRPARSDGDGDDHRSAGAGGDGRHSRLLHDPDGRSRPRQPGEARMMRFVAPRFRKLLRRLDRDEGGNVIVIYVAASLLLVAMVWAIIGSGARVVQHETIQSSADAAAFSASVIKAKGLNIIAFCNLVMALLLALVMLLRAIKYVLMGLAAFITACAASIIGAPVCGPLVGPVDDVAFEIYPQLEDKAERFIKIAMNGLHYTERAVAHVTPVLAFVEAYHIGTDAAYQKNFGNGKLVTVSWPLPIEELPVKDGTCQDLADNAVQYIEDISKLVLGKILTLLPGGGIISGWLSKAIAALAKPLAGTLCGGSMTTTVTEVLTDRNACLNASNVV